MELGVAALIGIAGAAVVEVLDVMAGVRRTHTWPWRLSQHRAMLPAVLAITIRLSVGGLGAAALAASGHVTRPFTALVVGCAGPLLFERLLRHLRPPCTLNSRLPSSVSASASTQAYETFAFLRRDQFPYDGKDRIPQVEQGREPPYAKVSLAPLEARVLTALSSPEIEEGLAADTGVPLSKLREILAQLVDRGYLVAPSFGRAEYRLSEAGEVLRKRLDNNDQDVVVATLAPPRRPRHLAVEAQNH